MSLLPVEVLEKVNDARASIVNPQSHSIPLLAKRLARNHPYRHQKSATDHLTQYLTTLQNET